MGMAYPQQMPAQQRDSGMGVGYGQRNAGMTNTLNGGYDNN